MKEAIHNQVEPEVHKPEKGTEEASHEYLGTKADGQKSSEDNQKQPTHDSHYVYKEETLDNRYQVKEQTCDGPYAEKQLTTSIVVTRI